MNFEEFSAGLLVWQTFLLIIIILGIVLPIIALIHLIKHDFNGSDKLIWALIILLFPLFGPILYFTIGKKQTIAKV